MAFPPVLPPAGALPPKAGTSPGEEDEEAKEPPTNYEVPEENKKIWKSFGCDTEAGRMLRSLYGNKGQYGGISYPTPNQQKWTPAVKEKGPCPQRAAVRVPRVTNRPSVASDAQPGASQWGPPPPPAKKPMADILVETNNYEKEKPSLPHGRDQGVLKERLQVQHEFGGGRMMPKGAMGNAPMEKVAVQPQQRRRPEEAVDDDGSGMTREQRTMYAEKLEVIDAMQRRLAEIDAEDASIPVTSKLKTRRNKEALQLQNDIDRANKDLRRLKDLAG